MTENVILFPHQLLHFTMLVFIGSIRVGCRKRNTRNNTGYVTRATGWVQKVNLL